ncbi:hypothetical protein KEM60_00239 [Austwickia sp. TVS 96-490-7B]|uniref:hypothetical protein n=1 Tax=Austwickia sp. TVS 96-490-7B TaxID=2830843 RepID=UPI001C59245C|nr:hypothetical protein [Austwickia sp. TVS 96-490-7B]MBW3084056.1 hypothetical protein [Austwickia sp. TVS 96-490-7B]
MDTTQGATISRTNSTHGRRRVATRAAAVVETPGVTASSLLDHCPTCSAANSTALDVAEGDSYPGVAAAICPTCGVSSIEYGLTLAIDATLREMAGLERLDEAL